METQPTTEKQTVTYGFKVMDRTVIDGVAHYKLLEKDFGYTTAAVARDAAEASMNWHKDLWSAYNVVGEVTTTVSTTTIVETLDS